MTRTQYWCFTLNNYTPENESEVQAIDCKYLCYGREVGESGTRHLQGYIEFSSRKRLDTVRRLFGGRAHWEPRRGTAGQANDYCTKDGDVFQKGTMTDVRPGQRTDLESLHEVGLTLFDSFIMNLRI